MVNNLINQEMINTVVAALAPIGKTNNLAARIDVLFRTKDTATFKRFGDDQIYSIRKIANLNKDVISEEIMEDIYKISDFFEALFIANKLS